MTSSSRLLAGVLALGLTLAACGSEQPAAGSSGSGVTAAASAASTASSASPTTSADSVGSSATDSATSGSSTSAAGSSAADLQDWDAVLAAAKGQTVNWYMYGGDDVLNGFVTGYVTDQLAAAGVTLNQVKITETADVVNKVLGEKQAGRTTDGSVDAIWINGENFATGVQAGLWYCGWDTVLPNSKFVDFQDPAIANDFGVPVNGCEAAWQQANSAVVYDSAKLGATDVASLTALFAWATANPGQFTYAAPPDFTGSMTVRTFLYDTMGGPQKLAGPFDEAAYTAAVADLWPRLNTLKTSLWRSGETYPTSQDAIEKLYADGEIAAFFTYGPGAVGKQVADGLFPDTTREAVLDIGNIGNTSFFAIPDNAANKAGAMVLANVLQDPATQLQLFTAEGAYPAIDVTRTSPEVQQQFAAVPLSASVLPLDALTANVQPELAAGYIDRIEKDWTTNVLQQ